MFVTPFGYCMHASTMGCIYGKQAQPSPLAHSQLFVINVVHCATLKAVNGPGGEAKQASKDQPGWSDSTA